MARSDKGTRKFGAGNYTRGPERRGYRKGRKPVYEAGTARHIKPVMLSERQWAAAVLFGKGNAAMGVRLAIEAVARQFSSLPPTEISARIAVIPTNPESSQWLAEIASVRSTLLGGPAPGDPDEPIHTIAKEAAPRGTRQSKALRLGMLEAEAASAEPDTSWLDDPNPSDDPAFREHDDEAEHEAARDLDIPEG